MSQLLLCIRAKLGGPECTNVYEGTTYTLHARISCACRPQALNTVLLEEKPAPYRMRLQCRYCNQPAEFDHIPFDANRFIPLNDPDATLDDIQVDAPTELVS